MILSPGSSTGRAITHRGNAARIVSVAFAFFLEDKKVSGFESRLGVKCVRNNNGRVSQ